MWAVENLKVWQDAVQLATDVYTLIRSNSVFSKDFGLKDQVQRSAVSIASNIAEWNDRKSDIEFCRYLYIARWSASELKTQLCIAKNISYITQSDFKNILEKITTIQKMINWLIASLSSS